METNATYQFRVRAENKYGISEACESEETMIKDPHGLPGPPQHVKIVEQSKTHMLVTWDPPMDSGGTMITGYWLEKREKGSAYWSRVNKAPITKRGTKGWEGLVTRLIEGTEYEFRCMACNSAGIGPPSAISESARADEPIGKSPLSLFSLPLMIFSRGNVYTAV